MQFILLHDYNYIENLIATSSESRNLASIKVARPLFSLYSKIGSFINQNNDVSIPFSLCIRTELNSLASY